mgnify:CR=1 FL=1
MKELKEKRDYKLTEFVEENGDHVFRIYADDIYYDNKLGVGDGELGFRQIDSTLTWDEVRRGWTFEFHNYRPFLPEYADEWFEYRDLYKTKDQTTRFRPICNHVQGVLVQNAIMYADAFAEGIDLIIKFTFRKMIKLVRVRDSFKPDADTVFDFEIELPNDKDFIVENERVKIGSDSYTYINFARAWDSGVTGENTGMKCELTPTEFVNENGKLILRKTLLHSFTKDSIGDVFTDATFTYSENKDTYYGTSFVTGGDPNGVELWYGGWGDFYYSFIEWDLSSIPSGGNIKSAKVAFYVNSVPTNNPNLNYHRVTASWTEAGVTSSSNPSWNAGAFATPTNTMTVGYDITNISGQVRDWRNGVQSNFGLTVRATSNNDARGGYASSDNSDSGKHPYIEVVKALRGTRSSMSRIGT